MLRDIVMIDEDLCDGCGQCVPACQEGAIKIIDGKARLIAESLCDGIGACLGHCPQDAIRIERRESAAFDEKAVVSQGGNGSRPHQARHLQTCPSASAAGGFTGCPSSQFARLGESDEPCHTAEVDTELAEPELKSQLTHWPIQLRLLPTQAPMLKGAHLLLAADCVPFAYPDFHRKMLRGKVVMIACPKLDETRDHVNKLADIIRLNDPASLTIAHMEVPCCGALLILASEACKRSGKNIPITHIVVGTRGKIVSTNLVGSAVRTRT